MSEPSAIETIPPTASTPWLVTLTSAMKSTMANRMSSRPAKLIGRLWKAKNARISEMPPMTPGRTAPGVDSSKMSPSVPSIISTYATFGSVITASTRSRKPISIGLATASRVASVTGPCDVFTVRPSSFVSRSGMESAMKSTTFSRTASRSVTDTDWRTAFSPHSALRPRSMAIVRMNAAASFSTLRMLSLSMPPPTDTGWAAPMFVAGAMAATWAAMVMKTPAEAARAPVGPTHTTTGISALSRRWQIARIERSRPPGVSSWMTSACAPPAFARVSALSMRRSVTGLMTPSMTTVATGAGAADAGAAASRTSATRTRTPWARRLIDRRGGPRYGPPASSSEGGYAPLGLPRPSLGRAPAHPGRASGLTQDVSSAEREDAHELEHEVGGQQRGDLAGPVVGRRDFDDVGARAVAAGQRSQDRERDRVVAADAHRRRAGLHDGVDPPLDGLERPLDGDRHHVDVAAVRHAQPLERMDLEHRVPRTDQRRLLAHGARTEARARAIRGAAVVRHPEQGDVQAGGVGRRGQQHEGRDLPEARRLERVARPRQAHGTQSAAPSEATAWASRATSSDEL